MPPPVIPSADELFAVNVTTGARAVRVDATGEIDTFTAPGLAAALAHAVSSGVSEITVGLRDVTFLDSSGVHVIADTYRRAHAAGIRLRVSAPRRAVRRTLELTGLWPLLGAGDELATGVSAA
jgi:anti-sigma B factor antagonist